MSKKILAEMFGVGGLVVIPALKEAGLDDVNKQLGTARSVFKTKRPDPRDKTHTPDTARAQSDMDSAKSIFDEAAGGNGAQITGDRETLDALMQCLQEAEHATDDPDISTWAGKAWKAVAAGIRGSGSVTLPKFEQADDNLMPDDGADDVEGERGAY